MTVSLSMGTKASGPMVLVRPLGDETSVVGAPHRIIGSIRAAFMGVLLSVGIFSESATATINRPLAPLERTDAGSTARIIVAAAEKRSSDAIYEIRATSGLTWEELASIFNVSRRSVHHWANGKEVAPDNSQLIRLVLGTMRQVDRGNPSKTRDLLFADRGGLSLMDLLRDGRFEDAVEMVDPLRLPSVERLPLSDAEYAARRPAHPAVLLSGAPDMDPPSVGPVRIGRSLKAPRA